MDADNKRLDFFAAIGAAVTNWEYVEMALCRAFQRLSGTQNYFASNAAFYAVISADARCKMVDAAAKMTFFADREMLKEWELLEKKIRSQKTQRNHFAHFSVLQGHFDGGQRYRLQPTIANPSNMSQTPKTYYVHDLNRSAVEFHTLADQIDLFTEKIKPIVDPS
jgi:hypothetical protein